MCIRDRAGGSGGGGTGCGTPAAGEPASLSTSCSSPTKDGSFGSGGGAGRLGPTSPDKPSYRGGNGGSGVVILIVPDAHAFSVAPTVTMAAGYSVPGSKLAYKFSAGSGSIDLEAA